MGIGRNQYIDLMNQYRSKVCTMYHIAGNFEGENFRGFRGLKAICESFLRGIWGHAAPTYDWFQAIRESFLHEILTSYGSTEVFSLESLLLYGMYVLVSKPDLSLHSV